MLTFTLLWSAPHFKTALFLLYVIAWLAGMAGFSIFVPILLGFAHLHSVWQYEKYLRMKSLLTVHAAMHDTATAQKIMGRDMPSWITHARVERSLWATALLASLWPKMSTVVNRMIKDKLNLELKLNKPQFLVRLEMSVVEIGPVPPLIDGIEVLKEAVNETVLDLHVKYQGTPDIRIVMAWGSVQGEIKLTDLQLSGVLRVVLGPHTDADLPCFACVSVSFVEQPDIFFNLSAAKFNLDSVPGLRGFLDGFCRETLLPPILFPQRIVIPVMDETQGTQTLTAPPSGSLTVVIHGCDNLPDKKSEKFFVETFLASNEEGAKHTATVAGPSPKFEKTMTFAVYDIHRERCLVRVFTFPGKKFVGQVELFIISIIQNPPTGALVQKLSNMKKMDSDLGSLFFSISYKRIADPRKQNKGSLRGDMSPAPAPLPDPPAPPSTPAPPLARPASRSGTPTVVRAPASRPPPASTSPSPARGATVAQSNNNNSGIAIIKLVNCQHLFNKDAAVELNPYVVVSIGGETQKTRTASDTLNPEYDQLFELGFEDAMRDTLLARVYNENESGHDVLVGEAKVGLMDVATAPQQSLRNSWRLEPQGRITLDIRLLF